MSRFFPQHTSISFHKAARAILALGMLTITTLNARSQSTSVTDGATPLALQPGAPNGAYALSGFDNINLFNGNLNFRLPIAAIAGRGEVASALMIPIERKWRVLDIHLPQPDGSVNHVYMPVASLWKTLPVLYNPGGVEGRHAGYDVTVCPDNTTVFTQSLTRLTFTTPDGTEHELRDTLTNGRPNSNAGCNYLTPVSRGTVFVTADGSAATFVSDNTIYDQVVAPGGLGAFDVSGFLMLRDGTRYRIDSGRITWMRDRNGNKITYAYDANDRVVTITDPLKRTVNITYASSSTTYDQITFKGFGGITRRILVNYSEMHTVLHSGAVKTFRQLFPELPGASTTSTFNPNVISSITLPNNQQYQFRYNAYGELARVLLPTGGAYEYDYTGGGSFLSGTTCCSDGAPTIYRVVTERRIYSDGGTGSAYENKATYTYLTSTPSTNVHTIVKQYKQGDANPVSQQAHYFYGSPLASLENLPTDYSGWNDGKEYQTDYLTANGTTVLKRDLHTFQQRTSVNWWPGSVVSNNTLEPPNDPRLTQTLTTLEPAGQNLVTKVTFGYDDSVPFNNRNNIKVYDFGVGSHGALLRETRSTYITSATYTGTSVHLRGLVSQVSIHDGTGIERSRTNAEFDNYTTDPTHAALTNCPNISGFESALNTSYTTRGNATCSTRSILVNGTVTSSLTSCRQFDIAGNPVKMIDARGFAVTTEYADRFGSPNGEARSNSAPAELGGQTSYGFPTKITNALGQTAYVQFDYDLSNPVDAEDPNGIVTSGYFNDALDRPSQIRRAVGTAIQNQTTFTYDDTNRVITTTKDRVSNNDNTLVAKLLYDKLGRTIEERQYEGATNYIAIQTQYDEFGRPFKTSKPFRPWQSDTPVWTTQQFDALSRVTSITAPDGSVISNSYSSNAVTVTDQKLRKRKSITDALGRQKHIYEDPDGLNYLTSYEYDVFDNLISVTQGTQTRAFVYNSLNQLTSATNPENGTTTYQYDNEGNLLVSTDARGVSAHFAYDALSRLTRRWYNGSSSIGATIHNSPALPSGVGTSNEATFYYDTQSLPTGAPSFSRGASLGRQVAVTYGTNSSAGDYFGYDALGRSVLKIQQTGGVNYMTAATYNVAGDTTSVIYPSGHTANYSYDNAGRTINFSGNLGDGSTRTYASTLVYNASGQITQELFGTATPLYHKLQYNIRSQLWDVRVSTGSDVNGSWNRGCLQFFYDGTLGYGTSGPDNNGNLLLANTYIPLDEQSTGWAIHRQGYTYDALNRLTSTTEYFVSTNQAEAQQSVQSYSYDRWGNRTINPGSTNGTGINNKVFAINTANNRLGVPGGQSGAMNYDAVGNLTIDTYSGAGNRTYDAQNRITSAWGNNQAQLSSYDGRNQRVTRTANGVTIWHVYGIKDELLAEYGANGAPTSPQKEYGYRSGQLLVTAEAAGAQQSTQNVNWSNTAGVSASGNSLTKTATSNWGNSGASSSQALVSGNGYVEFIASETTTSRMIGLSNGDANQNYTDIDFAAYLNSQNLCVYESGVARGCYGIYVTGDVIRVAIESGVVKYKKNGSVVYTSGVSPAYPLLVDTALWSNGATLNNAVLSGNLSGGGAGAMVRWLVADHLGTPRIIVDQTGNLAGVKRHDYLPFGEELFAGSGGRTAAQGYSPGDGVRQQFTSQERDAETGLDYFGARYHSSVQGRFTGTDPGSFTLADPQNLNRYSYVQNNPLKFIDPTGRDLYLFGNDADYVVAELERLTGLKLHRDSITGKVTIVPGFKRNTKGTSYYFADLLARVIRDPIAEVKITTRRNYPGIFVDDYMSGQLDVEDYNAFKKADPKLAAASLAHVIQEYYFEQVVPLFSTDPAIPSRGPLNKWGRFPESHEVAKELEGQVISDFTNWWEQPRHGSTTPLPPLGSKQYYVTVRYSTVMYDVIHKNGTILSITKYEKQKPRKQ